MHWRSSSREGPDKPWKMMMLETVPQRIRRIIREHARLAIDVDTLADDADLYQSGMSSHASVNVMLGLEEEFDVEFPDRMLQRKVFESVTTIASALEELVRDRATETGRL
jgi:acyl carrier protein